MNKLCLFNKKNCKCQSIENNCILLIIVLTRTNRIHENIKEKSISRKKDCMCVKDIRVMYFSGNGFYLLRLPLIISKLIFIFLEAG